MPNTGIFEAMEFFAGLTVGGPNVSENFARAVFQLDDGTDDVTDVASAHARRIFESDAGLVMGLFVRAASGAMGSGSAAPWTSHNHA